MIWFALSFLLWAIVHSVTAASSTKVAFRKTFGAAVYAGFYRLLYNIFSLLSFLPILYLLWTQVPSLTLWSIPMPWRIITLAIQLFALLGLALSLLQTDVWSFLGLRQVYDYLRRAENPPITPRLVTSGTYRWVRHPLYLFSLLFIWLNPQMTLASFIFNVLATLYFWIGSIYEERRLSAEFGEAYETYRRSVPRFLPTRIASQDAV